MEISDLAQRAQAADAACAAARADLVAAVRQAHRAGFSQREIAAAIGRSQPEVSRLLHFHGRTPGGQVLRRQRAAVIARLERDGLRNPRVFGSTARGEDGPSSDIDLLVSPTGPLGLLSQARLEHDLSALLERPVDVVQDCAIRPDLVDRIQAEAVPL